MSEISTIGGRIKQLRRENGFSQEYLAEALNTDQSTISKYEKDTRPVPSDVLANLSWVLKTTPTYLVLGNVGDEEFLSELLAIAKRIKSQDIQSVALENMVSLARLDEKQRR